MNIELKKIAGKSLILVSNDENIIYGTHTLNLDALRSISFSYNDMMPLQNAENTLEKDILIFMLKSCSGITKNDIIPELTNYKNAERLTVYIKETDKYYILISFGELQPTLYKIYIEGIFEKP